ncbi:MAG TPA: hypothetical protein VGJ17_01450 [Candidatus Limnocylindrales bacterium]
MSRRRRGGPIVLVSLLIIGGGSMLVGETRGPGAGRMDLSAAAVASTTALATIVDGQLGLPVPASRSVVRVTDTATGQAVDEVTDLDLGGTPMAITRFDLSGSLVSSIRLGYVAPSILPIAQSAAGPRATTIVSSLSVPVAGTPAVSARAAGGWLVRWGRLIGSVPAPGDGVTVQLADSGSFHAIVRTEHPIVAAPASTIDEARVRVLAAARLDAWFSGGASGQATISSVARAWVAPNDTFGDPLPAGAAGALHLAWVVRVTTSGALADQLAGLELAFDAGSGLPLGGDVLE